MHKLLSIAIAGAALLSASGAAQQQTVTCSAKPRAQTCAADTSNGVLLLHEQSAHACRLGKTWSYDRKGIHVSDGCSADFLVNPKHSNAFGEGGYRTYGTGVDAFHTNGHVGPSGGAAMHGTDTAPAPNATQPNAPPDTHPDAQPDTTPGTVQPK